MKMLRSIRKQKHMTMKELGALVGVSESAISQYETGKRQADFETLLKLGDALGCSVDYLLRGDETQWTPTLTAKDERDIARELEKTLNDLGDFDNPLMFDGEPLDDETRELLRASLENQIRMAKIIAKQKYTPKKYRKNQEG